MFRQLHHAYVDMLCNPFYIPGESITSRLPTVTLCCVILVSSFLHMSTLWLLFIAVSFIDSSPSLGVVDSVCLYVCLSRCSFKLLLLFCFSMESSHFLAVSSPCGTLQNYILRFTRFIQIYSPKFGTNRRTTFCRVPHGEMMAKKWRDSIEKQKRRIDWRSTVTYRRTDRVNDKI